MWPTGLYDMYAVIADFHAQHPGVAIHFVEGMQEELLAQIRADELDAIFTAVDPDALGDEFAATLLSEEEFVCTLPVGHPLAAQQHVTFQQLAGLDLVTYRENSALRRRPEPFTWPVALVWRATRRQPPAAKAFLALAIACAEQEPAVRLVA